MQVDYLTSRLDRLKLSSQQVAALADIRAIRSKLLNETKWKNIVSDEFFEHTLELFKKGQKPFQNETVLQQLNWKKCSEVIRKLLRELVRAGLKNGSIQALVSNLERNPESTHELCKLALDSKQEPFFAVAAKYNVEPELLRYIVTTPLVPLFQKLEGLLPRQQNPMMTTSCPLCGAGYSSGIYQAGYRFFICRVCDHRVRVDSFFCGACGNTTPEEMGFVTPKDEPVLQIDYCRRCASYFKMVHEEIMGTLVSDAVLLDLSTMDLDSLGKEVVQRGSTSN